MSEIKHSPLPFHACQYEKGTIYSADRMLVAKNVIFGLNMGLNDVEFIIEACNNYYKLKDQNEKLKEAINEYAIDVNTLYTQPPQLMSYKKMIETLKSCES